MRPLLRITSVPMQYELSSQRAKLEISQDHVKMNLTTQQGEVQIRQRQPKVQMDSFEMRKSMELKTVRTAISEAAQRGNEAAVAAIGDHASFGTQIMQTQNGGNIPDALYSKMMERFGGELVVMPLSPTDISWIPGGVEMNYSPTKMNFDWNLGRAKLDYMPGGVTMNITQYPSVQIEYLGEPIYVPPSSAPGYQGIA